MAVEQEIHFLFPLYTHSRFESTIPCGYYGNLISFPCANTTAEELANKPLSYAVQLIDKAKKVVNNEYMLSMIDFMEIKGRPRVIVVVESFVVSNVTKLVFGDVDFGWGKAMYGGPAKGGMGVVPEISTFLIPCRNSDGTEGILVPI